MNRPEDRKMRRALSLIFAALPILAGGLIGCDPVKPSVAPPPLRVAAAADLAKAFSEMGAAYQKETGQAVAFTFGASGTLTQQIRADAPFDVFAAANQGYIDQLAKAGKIAPETKALYAIGQVVLWTRKSDLPAPKSLADLKSPRFAHIALANPEHAPYGKAAREALQKAGLWSALQPKIVYGENAQQAFQFAQSGNADAALVSHALTFGVDGEALPVPPELYAPLKQAIAAVKASKQTEAARGFITFVTGAKGREILQKYGFALP